MEVSIWLGVWSEKDEVCRVGVSLPLQPSRLSVGTLGVEPFLPLFNPPSRHPLVPCPL